MIVVHGGGKWSIEIHLGKTTNLGMDENLVGKIHPSTIFIK